MIDSKDLNGKELKLLKEKGSMKDKNQLKDLIENSVKILIENSDYDKSMERKEIIENYRQRREPISN
jgi:hypothetical protein